jgi:hypothetical protein
MTATGLLWVKTVDGTTNVGPSALNLIYKDYINYNSIYDQLINNEIINFEVFFDTLIIQLTDTVLYEKITFNYDQYTIEKSLQNYLPLNIGTTSSAALSTQTLNANYGIPGPSAITYYGGNWYSGNEKYITVCTLLSTTLNNTGGLSSFIVPVLYRLDLNNPQERVRIYPTSETNFTEYVYPLTNVSYMEAPVFCYNEDTKLYLITFITFKGLEQQVNLINYKVNA